MDFLYFVSEIYALGESLHSVFEVRTHAVRGKINFSLTWPIHVDMLCAIPAEIIIKNLHIHLLSPINNKFNRTMLLITLHDRNCIDSDLGSIRRIFEHL